MPSGALKAEIERVSAEIDKIFTDTLTEVPSIPVDAAHRTKQVQTLGKLLLFDKQLSVNRNEACTFCHMPDVDFTGPISLLNMTTVAYPGSVRDAIRDPSQSRYGHRKPQSYTYAPYYPALQYNQTQEDFYGGNFWDLRAAEPTCKIPQRSRRKIPRLILTKWAYRIRPAWCAGFLRVHTDRSLRLVWGAAVVRNHVAIRRRPVCAISRDRRRQMTHCRFISALRTRGRSNSTYDQFALAIAAYEAAPEVSPFSSKFDYALAHPDQHVLSHGRTSRDGTFSRQSKMQYMSPGWNRRALRARPPNGSRQRDVGSKAPLFTDFTSSNLGVPNNRGFLTTTRTKPDQYGYTANPAGSAFVDKGCRRLSQNPTINPNSDWVWLAPQLNDREVSRSSTLRNVEISVRDLISLSAVHAQWLLEELEEVVHFYNTRDTAPPLVHKAIRMKRDVLAGSPEFTGNRDKTIGKLGLTNEQEDQLVAFLKTLTDGYKPQQTVQKR